MKAGVEFAGGLRLRNMVWLKGGEPRVMISLPEGSTRVAVTLDGKRLTELSSPGGNVDLRPYQLTVGRHLLVAGNEHRNFYIQGSDLSGSSRPELQLGYELKMLAGRVVPTSLGPTPIIDWDSAVRDSLIHVLGAAVKGLPAEPAMPARARDILPPAPPVVPEPEVPAGHFQDVVLGRHLGEVVIIPRGGRAWIPAASAQSRVGFEPSWIIRVGSNKTCLLEPVGDPAMPSRRMVNKELIADWTQWILTPHLVLKNGHHYLVYWQTYRELALEVSRALHGL
jgi:hypothetical protein